MGNNEIINVTVHSCVFSEWQELTVTVDKGGNNMKWFDYTALTIVIIGAVNWLLIGIFRFDLVAFLFGNLSWLSRIVYTVVGLCGLYLISFFGRIRGMSE